MSLQSKIIKLMNVRSDISPHKEIFRIVSFIKRYVKTYNLNSLILGISGGQDSTLVGKLCKITINELKSEIKNITYNLIAIRMPYGKQKDEKDCQKAINFINPNKLYTIDIKPSVLFFKKELIKHKITISEHALNNRKARERMQIQYSIASMNNGIVVGTKNAAENVVGYFTKYGDGGSDINPISHLNKRQGKKLLKLLNCPSCLYNKKPTADFNDDFDIDDETMLGVKYSTIDDYLEGKKVDFRSKSIIENLFKRTMHKRNLPVHINNNDE